jgi:hypothetical protein
MRSVGNSTLRTSLPARTVLQRNGRAATQRSMRGGGLLALTAMVLFGCGGSGGQASTPGDASSGSATSGSATVNDGAATSSTSDSATEASASDAPRAADSLTPDAADAQRSSPSDGSAVGDTSSAAFTDPNPLPCAGVDPSALCLMGWTDTSHTFTGCCLTTFAQDPQGKCGLSAASSPCIERKAPGNPDPKCPADDWTVCFAPGNPVECAGGFRVGGAGAGAGCCQWRNATCGVAADDFGCIEYSTTIYQGMPCTPDYDGGSQYP